jgi:Tol biopolymer transport system component
MKAWRTWSAGIGAIWLVACGGGGTEPDGGSQARCSLTAPFGTPRTLMSLNTPYNDEQPGLSPDELTVYFSRDDGGGNYDIYQATRASKDVAFGNVVAVAGVNTSAEDRGPRVTADELTMFAASKAPTVGSQIHVTSATRASKTAAFGALQPVATVNGAANDNDPFILADGRVLYFASDRGGNYALYRSVQTGGVFSTPVIVVGGNLNTVYTELSPVVSQDELTLYFASTRPAPEPRSGEGDIYQATRASPQDAFGEPKFVTELNTIDPESPSWISADGCDLYFTRYTPANSLELAVATRGKQ